MKLKTFKWFLLAVAAGLAAAGQAQVLTITNGVQKYGSLSGATVTMSGRSELWVTNSTTPLSGCLVNLNSSDAWLFLPGIKPSVVQSTYLGQVHVNGAAAVANGNVRVVEYAQNGAVVIPQSPSFQPLTVFSQPQFGGTSNQLSQWTYYTGTNIAGFGSFKLKRGYQVVLAASADGKNNSQCYVAQDGDLELGVLPATLNQQVKFIYVTPWRWVSKKGIAGNPGNSWLNVNWWYDWNIDQSSTSDLEYVAIRQNQGWPPLNQNWQALGINTLLGYNEPDQANQANLSVSNAISSWGDLLATGLRVGAPAVSDGGPASWLFPFMQQANADGLRVDFVPIHYYQANNPANPAACASQMYNFLLNVYNNTHRPIWVTEWNNGANWTDNNPWPVPTYAQQQACVAAMVSMLESTPFVERYAFYNWVEDPRSLVTSSNTVTPAGVTYSNMVSALSYSQALPANPTRGMAQFLFASNTEDSSGYCNNALASSAPSFAAGHNSQAHAIVLDGADNFVQLPANIAGAPAFTYAGWVYWNGGAAWQRIFDFGNDTSHYLFLTPSSGSGTLRFAINNGNGEQIVETSPLTVGIWQHVAVTLGGGVESLYVNGRLAASTSGITNLPSEFSPAKNYLGKSQFPADPLFNGRFDGVEITDYAMTAAQIAGLYTNQPSSLPPFSSGIWTNDADGDWSVSNNWDNGLPANGGNGVDYSADFSAINISASRTVTLDSARTIGGLAFGDPSGSNDWTLAGTNALTLDTGSTDSPAISVLQNTATLAVPLAGDNGFAKSGAGTLVLSGTNAFSGVVDLDSESASANDGTVLLRSAAAMGAASAIQFRNSGAGVSTLQVDGTGGDVILPQAFGMSGRNSSAPEIESLAGANTLAGTMGIQGVGSHRVQVDSGLLNLSGLVNGSDTNLNAITIQGSGMANLNGVVENGSGIMGLNKDGSGTLAVGPGSSYSGWTTVSQGSLELQPLPTPLLHFSFENTAGNGAGSIITNTGSGGSSMNGTLTGAATIVSGGRFGNALSIPSGAANAGYVLVNNPVVGMTGGNGWTIAMWVKTGTAGGVYAYQGSGGWASGNMTFYLNEGSDAGYGAKAGGVSYAQGWEEGSTSINDGNWHFLAMTCNGSTKAMYVDGKVDAIASSWAADTGVGDQFWVGGSPDTGDQDIGLNGLIDEVYVFDGALSQSEIQSLYAVNQVTNIPANVLPVATTLDISTGGTLDLAGISQEISGIFGGGILTNSGTSATLTVSNSTANPSLFSGSIGDTSAGNPLSLFKAGSGTFVLSGSNTYHGNTTVNTGTLRLSSVADDSIMHLTFDNPPGGLSGTVITNVGLGGSAFNGRIVGSGASIVTGGRFGNALSINGTGGTSESDVVWIYNPGVNTSAMGNWTVGYWVKTTTAGAVIMYQGDGSWSSAGQTEFYLNNGGTNPGTHAGAVRYAGGWLTGTAALNDGNWHFVTVVDNDGDETLFVDGNTDAVTSTLAGALASDVNQIWIGGSPDPGDGAARMTGLIDEVYMFDRPLSQAEVQELYTNNNLGVNGSNVLPPTTPVTVAAGATLDLGGVSQTLGSISGNGTVTDTGGPATLTLHDTGSTSFAGTINDTSPGSVLGVVQEGNGTTVLSGVNSYHGATIVNGGTLLVNGTIGTGAVTVAGGTLGGHGTLGGAVTVQSGGTLAPGGGLTAMTVNNNVTLDMGSTTTLEISELTGTSDQLAVSGNLICGGTLLVTNLAGTLAAGDSYKLFQAGLVSGTFNSMVLPTLGGGLGWSTANLNSGIINVVQTTSANLLGTLSGSNLDLSWPAGCVGWRLQVQTNGLGIGLGTNWQDVAGASMTNSVTLPANPGVGSAFYRLVYP